MSLRWKLCLLYVIVLSRVPRAPLFTQRLYSFLGSAIYVQQKQLFRVAGRVSWLARERERVLQWGRQQSERSGSIVNKDALDFQVTEKSTTRR